MKKIQSRVLMHEHMKIHTNSGIHTRVCIPRDGPMHPSASFCLQALEFASLIASKSPVAVTSTKFNLNYARDHSIQDGLLFMRTWNAAMLQWFETVFFVPLSSSCLWMSVFFSVSGVFSLAFPCLILHQLHSAELTIDVGGIIAHISARIYARPSWRR